MTMGKVRFHKPMVGLVLSILALGTSAIGSANAAQANASLPIGGPFSGKSVWKLRIDRVAVAANSHGLVANLVGQVEPYYGGVAAFNVTQYNTTVYTVPKAQQQITVRFNDCQHKGYIPTGLYGKQGQFVAVPVPSNAKPSVGTDSALNIYQPSTDTLWEFWKMSKSGKGWSACWGGRLGHVSRASGWFLGGFGGTASGLASVGGTVGIREVQRGRIDHALALQVIQAASWQDVSWPAQRSDGSDTRRYAIPEGTRFRLDPRVDVKKLQLTSVARIIARAAQRYGFIVTDQAGAVAVVAESGIPTQQTTGVNPWSTLMKTTPSYEIMRNFPWDKLQALPKNYGRTN